MFLSFGEIMARISPAKPLRLRQALPGKVDLIFAGAEANLLVSLSLLKNRTRYLTAVPEGPLADAALGVLRSYGVDTSRVLFREGRFGAYYFEIGAGPRSSNVLYDRAGSSIACAAPREYGFDSALRGVKWVHLSGITPALSENAFRAALELARKAKRRRIPVSFDLNFRSKLWRWSRRAEPGKLARACVSRIMPYVTVLFGSPEGAAHMLNLKGEGLGMKGGAADVMLLEDFARGILGKYGNLAAVALTLREVVSAGHNLYGGMLLDAKRGAAYFAPLDEAGAFKPYDIDEIVDPLGAGDAFAAGLLHALGGAGRRGPADAIKFATAAGCLKHSIPGDFNLVSEAEIESLAKGSARRTVSR